MKDTNIDQAASITVSTPTPRKYDRLHKRHGNLMLKRLTALLLLSVATFAPMPAVSQTDPCDGALTWTGIMPDCLSPGDNYRILFVTSRGINATSNSITAYNSFIQTNINLAGAPLNSLTFRALGSTTAVNARDNTGTTGAGAGIRTFYYRGRKVADSYTDLYDGTWDTNEPRDEDGTVTTVNRVFTGTRNNGTTGLPLGSTTFVDVGNPRSTDSPLSLSSVGIPSSLRPVYALSDVLTVPDLMPMFTPGASIPPQTYTVGTTITPLTLPVATGGNPALTYTIAPTLPAGLTLGGANGNILSGIPGLGTVQTITSHTYTVNDADTNTDPADTDTIDFTITVNAATTLAIFGDLSGVITEDAIPNTVSGTVNIAAGSASTMFTAQTATAGTYGSFTLTPVAGNDDMAMWTYTLDNSNNDVNALASATDTLTETLPIAAVGVPNANVTITITGVNDAPTAVIAEGPILTVAPADPVTLTSTGSGDPESMLTYRWRIVTDGNPSLSLAASSTRTNTISFTAPNVAGTDDYTIRLVVNDGTSSSEVDIIVRVVNSAADPTITIAADTASVTEGTAAAFTLTALPPAPAGGLTVTVSVTQDGTFIEGMPPTTVTIAADATTAALTVDTSNDNIDEAAGSVTATVEDGTGYTVGTGNTASVMVNDDDTADLSFTETEGTTIVTEMGSTDTYTVELATEPTNEVTIAVVSGNDAAATVSPPSLTFTTTNWDTPQTVTVTGVNDDIDFESDPELAVSHTGTSTDSNYEGLSRDVAVTVTDNDTADVTVSEMTRTVVENGGTMTYTIMLDTEPLGDVTITPVSDATLVATVSSALTFTTTNWDTPQTVTVTGVNDAAPGERTATVSHTPASTDDPIYAGLTIASVVVTATDDNASALLAAVTPLGEGNLNRPTDTVTVTVTLMNTVYVPDAELDMSDFTLTDNVAGNVTVSDVARTSDRVVTLTLTHGGEDITSDGMLSVTVPASAHTGSDNLPAGSVPIDATAPTVNFNQVILISTGPYGLNNNIEMRIDFSENVFVTGVPNAVLLIGGNQRDAAYHRDSGSRSPVFRYTVVTGDDDADGVQIRQNTLLNGGGIIRDAAGNDAVRTGTNNQRGFGNTHRIDATLPMLSIATVAGDTLVLTYNEALDTTSTPVTADYVVTVDTAPVAVNAGVAISGMTVTLRLASTVPGGQAVTLNYTPGANPVQDTVGNDAARLTNQGVTSTSGTVAVSLNTIAGDDIVNIDEQADGFTISGTMAAGSTVTVTIGGSATTRDATETGTTTWTLDIPANDGEITDPSVVVVATATLLGVTGTVTRPLTVDLVRPTATYAPPPTLTVGIAITDIMPGGPSADIARYAVQSGTIPPGLTLASDSGVISGAPTAADATTTDVTIRLTDEAGNTEDLLPITFPIVAMGSQTLTGFTYSSSTAMVGQPAPTVTPPTGAVAGSILSYTTTSAVCTVSATGALTLVAAGDCVIMVTASATTNYNEATDTFTITVSGAALPSISIAAGTAVTEGTAATFTLTADPAPAGDLTVTVTVTDSGTFIAGAAPTTVTITGSETTAMLEVTTTDDSINEANGMITATVEGGAGYTVDATNNSDSVTVNDDDALPMLAIDSPSVAEGNAGDTPTLSYTVTLTGEREREVTVDYADTTSGTATSGTDYEAVTAGTLTFAPGTTTQNIDVTVMGDADDEGDETVILRLSGETNATITTADGTGTITNDDSAVALPSISIAAGTAVTEGTAATFTLTADPAPAGDLTVTVTVTDSGTFIAGAAPTTVTITGSETTAMLEVTTTDDSINEANGMITATVEGGAGYTVDATNNSDSVTVNDDDALPMLAIDSPSVAEGNAGDTPTLSYTVTLTGEREREVTVDYADTTSGTATSGTDYETITAGTLTFAPGTTTQNIDVTVMGDADDEGDETVILRLSGETNATITTADGTGTITNDDSAVALPSISIAAGTAVTEGTAVTFTLTADPAPGTDLTVTVTVTETGTFIAGAAPTTVTITGSETTAMLEVTTTDDSINEANGMITATVEGGAGYTVDATNNSDSVTVNDDDALPMLAIDSPSVAEGNAGDTPTLSYTVTLTGEREREVTVDYADTTSGTATSGTDYETITAGTLTFAPGTTTQNINVTVMGDADDEGDETVILRLSGETNATITTADGTGTITDDDGGPVAGITVTPVTLSVPEDGGTTDTYTLVLNTAPTADVTIAVASDTVTAATVSSASLTFSTTNWNTAQTVTVTGVNDDVDNPSDERTATVSHVPTSADAGYTSVVIDPVTVTVTDDDDAGVTVDPTTLSVLEADGTSTYTVVLDTQPTGNVTITPESGDTMVATVSGALTFTTTNWNTAQTVTVTGVDDSDVNTPDRTATVTHTATSTDGDYNTVPIANVVVTATDDDVAAASALLTAVTPLGEMNLRRSTTNTVTVTVTLMNAMYMPEADLDMSDFTLTDDVAGDVTVSTVTRTSDRVVTLRLAHGGEDITSDGMLSVTVLASAHTGDGDLPAGSVPIDATAPTVSSVAFSTTGPYGLGANIEVTITFSENVFVTGTPNAVLIIRGNRVDAAYNRGSGSDVLIFRRTVVAIDGDDLDGVNILEDTLASGGGIIRDAAGNDAVRTNTRIEGGITQRIDTSIVAPPSITIAADTSPVTEGTAAEFTLTASSAAPVGGLTVTVSVTDSGNFIAGAAPTTVTITGGETTAMLTVMTEDDSADEANGMITVTVEDGTGYTVDGSGNTASVMVNDNDAPAAGVIVTPATLSVPEDGGSTADYTLVLNTAPTADVTIAVESDTVTAATVSSASLTFTPTNWDTAQTVTVTGVNDDIDNPSDERTATVTHVPTSADAGYTSVVIASVTVTVTDDDDAGVTVDPMTLSVLEADGTADYTLVLDTVPTADVTIAVASDTVTAATVSSASLTFTPTNWNTAQTVTVTGVNDDVPGDRTATVTHTATSADGNYEGVAISIASVTVTVEDDDAVAGVTVTPATLSVPEDGGTTADYTLVLDTAPTADVTIAVASDTVTAATVSSASLTFTPTNWNTAQTVTVTGVNDDVDNPSDERTATVTHAPTSADAGYGSVVIDPVTVTVDDDDTADVTVDPMALMVPEASGTSTYTVVLDTEPLGDVTITPESSDTMAATVSGALTFTATNWNTPQTVTVTGVNDDDDNPGNARTASLIHTASGSDTIYNSVVIDPVTVTVTDDDGPTALLEAVSPTTLGARRLNSSTNRATVRVTLMDTVYVDTAELTGADFMLTDDVDGDVTVESAVTRDSDTVATLTLGHSGGISNDGTVSVTVLASAHTGSGDLPAVSLPIDATAPTVSSVAFSTTGPYGLGADIEVTITFSEDVFVEETTPNALLIIGISASEAAPYNRGEGSNTLVFRRTVGAGDDDADGVDIQGGVLLGGGGIIRDVAGNNVVRSGGTNNRISGGNDQRVDTSIIAPPSITIAADTSPVTEGTAAAFTLTASPPAPVGGLTVTVSVSQTGTFIDGPPPTTVTIAAAATTAALTVATTDDNIDEAAGSVTATVTAGAGYTVGSGNTASVTVDDNDAGTAPVLQTATVNRNMLALGYDTALDSTSTPAGADYTLMVDAGPLPTVSTVVITSSTATLTLSESIIGNQTVTLDYTPGTNPLRDLASNNAVLLDDQAVVNTTRPFITDVVISSDPGADETYAIGEDIEVTVTFSEAVGVTGTPEITIPGITVGNANADFVSGSGTTALVFRHTVAEGVLVSDGIGISNLNVQGGEFITASIDSTRPADRTFTALPPQSGHKIDGVRPALSSATVDDVTLTLAYAEALDGASTPANGDYTVMADSSPVTVSGVSISGMAVTLTLATAVTSGQAVTLDYTPGTNPVQDTVGNDAVMLDDQTVGAGVLPSISITAVSPSVTEGAAATFTLTATPAPAANLTVMVTVTETGTFISGAAPTTVTIPSSGSVTLTVPTTDDSTDEANGTITATVTAGSGYTVGSPLTASVTVEDNDAAPVTPDPAITIAAVSPSVTEGAAATFTLTATPAPAANLTVMVTVTETGTFINGAAPTTVTIPSSGSVTLTVPTTDDATDEANGTITATVTAGTGYTVGSPPTASVTVEDNDAAPVTPDPVITITAVSSSVIEGAAATFTLMATPAPAANLTVMVTVTETGTFISGAAPTTVTIPSSGSVTLTVPTTDDATDEANGTITARVTAGTGYTVGSPLTASVTVEDNDGVTTGPTPEQTEQLHEEIAPQAVQAIAGNVVASVGARIETAIQGGPPTGGVRLDGQGIEGDGKAVLLGFLDKAPEYTRSIQEGTLNWKRMLANSSFALNAAGGHGIGGAISLWGSGHYTEFNGDDNNLDWDGDSYGFQIGADTRWNNNLLTGLSVSWSEGEVEYIQGSGDSREEGDYTLTLAGIHPYLGWSNDSGSLSLWGSFGYADGEVEIEPDGGNRRTHDTTLVSVAGGFKHRLTGFLNVKGDFSAIETDIDESTDVANDRDMTVDSQRLRLLLEGYHQNQLGGGRTLTQSAEVGYRVDGGDSDADTDGAELALGFDYHNPAAGLTLAGKGRALVGNSDYREWSVSGLIRLQPQAYGQGLTFTLEPGYGGTASEAGELWNRNRAYTPIERNEYGAQMKAHLGYRLNGFVTPYTEVTSGEALRRFRMGVKWQLGEALDLDLFGEQYEADESDHSLQLEGKLEF